MRRHFRQSITTTCKACGGAGKLRGPACQACGGGGMAEVQREVIVAVPPGAPAGHEIRFKGAGPASL